MSLCSSHKTYNIKHITYKNINIPVCVGKSEVIQRIDVFVPQCTHAGDEPSRARHQQVLVRL